MATLALTIIGLRQIPDQKHATTHPRATVRREVRGPPSSNGCEGSGAAPTIRGAPAFIPGMTEATTIAQALRSFAMAELIQSPACSSNANAAGSFIPCMRRGRQVFRPDVPGASMGVTGPDE